LSYINTSYQFHKELESPKAFIRREWKAFAIFGGGFTVVLMVAVFVVPSAYFYPRLVTDPLLYYLKGLSFAETGQTAARVAVNRAPFNYVSMPGILRSPFMLAFHEFDYQLRAIQLSNILLVGVTAAMYAYILSWIVPRRFHWVAIGFAFASMLLSPDWGANVFAALADAPYAAFTVAFVLLAARVLVSNKRLSDRRIAIATGAVLFTLAFFVRFTAPILFAYAAVLGAGRARHHRLPRKLMLASVIGGAAIVTILVAFSWRTIESRYLMEPYLFLVRGDKRGMLMSLMASALPTQIITDFHLGFAHQPIIDPFHVKFGKSPGDVALMWIGIAVSLTTFYGMWRSRHRFAPEIAYVLVALPLLTLIIPSTARYLMAYQPFLWVFFYAGAAVIVGPLAQRVASSPRAALIGLSLLVASGLGLVVLRSERITGTLSDKSAAISIGESRAYIRDVSSTFQLLREFIETLPRDRTLLVGARGTVGRWKVIANRDYYAPDSALSVATAEHETYLVTECGTLDVCQNFNWWDETFRQSLDKYGDFSFEPVFAHLTPNANARVYRIRNRQ
jgi:hypothetical protein